MLARLALAELNRLDPQIRRQQRLVLLNLANHRLGRLPREEELNDPVWALTTPRTAQPDSSPYSVAILLPRN